MIHKPVSGSKAYFSLRYDDWNENVWKEAKIQRKKAWRTFAQDKFKNYTHLAPWKWNLKKSGRFKTFWKLYINFICRNILFLLIYLYLSCVTHLTITSNRAQNSRNSFSPFCFLLCYFALVSLPLPLDKVVLQSRFKKLRNTVFPLRLKSF